METDIKLPDGTLFRPLECELIPDSAIEGNYIFRPTADSCDVFCAIGTKFTGNTFTIENYPFSSKGLILKDIVTSSTAFDFSLKTESGFGNTVTEGDSGTNACFVTIFHAKYQGKDYYVPSGYYMFENEIPEAFSYIAFADYQDEKFVKGSVVGIQTNWLGEYNFSYTLDQLNNVAKPMVNIADYLDFNDYEPTNADPYMKGGYSQIEGGNGTFDDTSNPVDFTKFDELFNKIGTTGLVSFYNPTIEELISLGTFLWSDKITDALKKWFNNPIECIVSLMVVPYKPETKPAKENIMIGSLDSEVQSEVCKYLFDELDFGEIKVTKFYDAKWDYSPYTSVTIYLPYIGTKTLDIDEIMGKTLHLKYFIEKFSGSCVAQISVDGYVLYQFDGNVGTQIPLSGRDYSQLISALISGVGNAVGGVIAGAGLSFVNPALGAATAVGSAVKSITSIEASRKPQIERVGNLSANKGLLSIQQPYLIYKIPRQNYPKEYGKHYGYPINAFYELNGLTGYTEIEEIHLENIIATSSELDEIENLLKEGVIL